MEGVGEAIGRTQGVGVGIAQHPAPAGQDVLEQLASPQVVTVRAQVNGQIVDQAVWSYPGWGDAAGQPARSGRAASWAAGG